jgi:hypothetical protein
MAPGAQPATARRANWHSSLLTSKTEEGCRRIGTQETGHATVRVAVAPAQRGRGGRTVDRREKKCRFELHFVNRRAGRARARGQVCRACRAPPSAAPARPILTPILGQTHVWQLPQKEARRVPPPDWVDEALESSVLKHNTKLYITPTLARRPPGGPCRTSGPWLTPYQYRPVSLAGLLVL